MTVSTHVTQYYKHLSKFLPHLLCRGARLVNVTVTFNYIHISANFVDTVPKNIYFYIH